MYIFHLKIDSKPLCLDVQCSLQRILLTLQVLLRPDLGVCTERDVESSRVFFQVDTYYWIEHVWAISQKIFRNFHYKWWRMLMIKLWSYNASSTKMSRSADDTTCFPCTSFELFPLGVQNSAPKHVAPATLRLRPSWFHHMEAFVWQGWPQGLWIDTWERRMKKLPLQ